MRRYSITNNGEMEDRATPPSKYFVITDLETGQEIEDVNGFYLEVDTDIGYTNLKLRTPGNNRSFMYQLATPNYNNATPDYTL